MSFSKKFTIIFTCYAVIHIALISLFIMLGVNSPSERTFYSSDEQCFYAIARLPDFSFVEGVANSFTQYKNSSLIRVNIEGVDYFVDASNLTIINDVPKG